MEVTDRKRKGQGDPELEPFGRIKEHGRHCPVKESSLSRGLAEVPGSGFWQHGDGDGEGGLTKESAISLRVWSDPTAKITLASGETVTEL